MCPCAQRALARQIPRGACLDSGYRILARPFARALNHSLGSGRKHHARCPGRACVGRASPFAKNLGQDLNGGADRVHSGCFSTGSAVLGFYALPLVPGMPHLGPLTAAIIVLSLIGASYGAEIVRSGIESISVGQRDACHALGLSRRDGFVQVILPQALTQIVPAFGSLAADMVKWTSIVSFVGVQDVLYAANSVRTATYATVPVFCLLAALYWGLCVLSGMIFRAVEKQLPLTRARRAAAPGTVAADALASSQGRG